MIKNLDLMIKDNAPELLAKELKIELGSAKEIQKIEYLHYSAKLAKKPEDRDTVVLGLPFKIKAYVSKYKEGINLYQENLNLSSALVLIENIQVIQYFTPRKKTG